MELNIQRKESYMCAQIRARHTHPLKNLLEIVSVQHIVFIIQWKNHRLTCVALTCSKKAATFAVVVITITIPIAIAKNAQAHIILFYFNFIGMLIGIIVSSIPMLRTSVAFMRTKWNFIFLCGTLMDQFRKNVLEKAKKKQADLESWKAVRKREV